MLQNPSSVLNTMQVTLQAISTIQELLEELLKKQPDLLDPENSKVYSKIKECLSNMEQELKKEIRSCEDEPSTYAPNLHADDDSANSFVNSLWERLRAKITS